MKEIQLTRGKVAIISDEDFAKLSDKKWTAKEASGKFYAVHYYRRGKKVFALLMHRLIMDVPKGIQIDHRNGNSLDNRRENLRHATQAQNMHNKRPFNALGVKGVYANKSKNKPYRVNFLGKYYGSFETVKEAGLYYDKLAREKHGEFAYQNYS